MGQAKQRGTFEQRREMALYRNHELEHKIHPDSPAYKFRQRHGIQRLATMLVASGVLSVHSESSVSSKTLC